MKITPLEIRQKTFEKVFRGYDKDEVNAYLQSLSMEWERLLDENKELYHKIEHLEAESSKLRELESSLFKTLKTAEDTGATLIEQAKKETDLKLKESNMKAEAILSEARSRAKHLVETAESKRSRIMDEMISRVKKIEELFNQMTDLKDKVVGQVRNYSTDLMERIEKLERKSESLRVEDIVAEARKIYNTTADGEDLDEGKSRQKPGRKEEEDTQSLEAERGVKPEKQAQDHAKKVSDRKAQESSGESENRLKHKTAKSAGKKQTSGEEESEKDQDNPWQPEAKDEVGEDRKPAADKGDENQGEIAFKNKKKSESTSKSFFDEID